MLPGRRVDVGGAPVPRAHTQVERCTVEMETPVKQESMFVRDEVLQVGLSVEECTSALDEWKVTHGKVAREAKGKEIVDRLAVY